MNPTATLRLLSLVAPLVAAPGCFAHYIGEASSVRRALDAPDREHVAVAAVTARAHRPVYLRAHLIALTTPNPQGRVGVRGYNRTLTAGMILLAGCPAWAALGVGIGFALGGYGPIIGGASGGVVSIIHLALGSLVTLLGVLRPSQELTGGDAARVYFDAPAGTFRFGFAPTHREIPVEPPPEERSNFRKPSERQNE
jgi:hypothetical protein